MNKYYTVEQYAKLQNQDESTIRKQITSRKLKNLQISQSQQISQLIVINENPDAAIISLMNLKGGCSKTTTASHLAILLAKLKYKVLLIDTDHQNQCRLFFPQQNFDGTLVDAVEGGKLSDCICKIQNPDFDFELDMVFSDYDLALVSTQINDHDWLTKNIDPIRQDYDFIIIDTSPNFDMINRCVARASSHIIIPLVPTTLHFDGLNHNFKGLEKVAKVEENRVVGILPTIVEPKLAQQRYYLDELKASYPKLLFKSQIPKDTYLPKTTDFRTNIFDLRDKSKASQSIKKFVWELLQRL